MSLRALVDVLERSEATKTSRLVLLALADHAHDDGSNAWPGVPTIARKARCDERTVQRALRALEAACEIVSTGTTRRGVTIWHLTVVTPLALPTGIEGRQSDTRSRFLQGQVQGSGGELPPEDGATKCHPQGGNDDGAGIPFAVQRWIGQHALGFAPDDARSVLEDNFRLRGDDLARALDLLDRRRLNR